MPATPHSRPLAPQDIAHRAASVSEAALASGVLEPIPTHIRVVEQAGVRFQLRVLDSHWRKQRALERQRAASPEGEARDPFGPCDPALLLGDLSETHCCVLNRYPALAGHLLIVTRAYEGQERLLTVADFHALWLGLAGIDGLGFYNGGPQAGASQRHKHLQLLPTPMLTGEPAVPMATRFDGVTRPDGIGQAPGLPFVHALTCLPPGLSADPRQAAVATLGHYHRLLAAVGLARRPGGTQAGPYNLLMTRSWMLLIPRTRDDWQGVSVNALGYAGSLLARDEAALARIQDAGPMRLLSHTGVPRHAPGRGPADPGLVG
jgi:ATP adenylyltransferase